MPQRSTTPFLLRTGRTAAEPGFERWLPRVILGGMLTLVLALMAGMGGYYIYQHQQAVEAQTEEIAARAYADRERILGDEVTLLTRDLQSQRLRFESDLREQLRLRVAASINVIASLHAALSGTRTKARMEADILHALRPMYGLSGNGTRFVIGIDGRARLFPIDTRLEGTDLRTLQDDTGLKFGEELIDAAADSRGRFVRFRWSPPGEHEAMADAIAYVRRFDPLDWVVGSAEFIHIAYADLRQNALALLTERANAKASVTGIDDDDTLLVIDRDGKLLAGPAAIMHDADDTPPPMLLRYLQRFVAQSQRGGGPVRFETPPTGTDAARRYMAYTSTPDEWGWTLVSISALDQIEHVIAQERERMNASTSQEFRLTAITMLAAATLATLLSVLFYRWIEARFRRYHADIAERNRALSENARELHLSARVFEASSEAIAILDHRFRIVSVNPALERISGRDRPDLIGRHCAELLAGGQTDDPVWVDTAAQLHLEAQWSGELALGRPNGAVYPAWVSVGAVTSEAGQVTHYVVSIADISDRKRTEQRLRHLAEYDALTGLPNRVLLLDRMSAAIESARRHRHHLAVLFLDLDRFKNINDSLGHAVGDELLRQVAARLGAIVRGSDTVSRLGGDEFVVLLTELDSAGHAATVAAKMLEALAAPFLLDGHELTITPSIGITVYPEDGENRDILLKNADAAMYHAKENGRNSYQFFTRELNDRARVRLDLENDLRRALARHEFTLAYQPQFDLATGHLIGAEALVRWHHPERGIIPPDQFIPIAEETGLIVPLGAWILRQACATGQAWRDEGLADITIAVNISAHQVRRGQLELTVRQVLNETAFSGHLLELEVTESALMANQAAAATTLKAIQAMGVRLAIDDFGTGYSSLGYLKRFALDKLKIDRSFINDLPDDNDDAHLTRAIIGIGHTLDMLVIAEGVETEAQERFLTELGCDQAQGYLYARPLPAADFRQMQIDLKYQATSKPASSTA
ncbi:EAL domain-containing protein [Nitrogeniibacter mangrovi]|uniref:EAL domain-containing protein n=1 Tax=Nitrogeniibacter mangrovi TaxID=2016596 RepID=A0A6C1B0S7_9RHOO|nr:EAL domain-containing protein [Nitrogeniibacter mangrovi]QID17221.1 EAL domain-containing protein [Nitrogeniibacter mangrovi]